MKLVSLLLCQVPVRLTDAIQLSTKVCLLSYPTSALLLAPTPHPPISKSLVSVCVCVRQEF